jgi:hypothetical protein
VSDSGLAPPGRSPPCALCAVYYSVSCRAFRTFEPAVTVEHQRRHYETDLVHLCLVAGLAEVAERVLAQMDRAVTFYIVIGLTAQKCEVECC